MRVLVTVLLTMILSVSRAELLIEITEGRVDAVPIAVVPFPVSGEKPSQDIAQIVAADLHRSGQFKPIAREDMLSRPGLNDVISFRDFKVLNSEYVVTGSVSSLPDGKFSVSYALYDVNQQLKLFGETYQPKANQLRDVAHAISDKIYEQITGVAGVFSTKILYVTMTRGQAKPFELQYADADGARVQTILRSAEPIMSPSWSPDGKKVAYVSFESDGLPAIFIHELATSNRRKVSASRGINGAPDWSPDGQSLALTLSKDGNPEIYTLDLASGNLNRLTNHYGIDTEPRWLPDGSSLIFTSNRSGGPQIYKVSLKDGSVRRVSFQGRYNARPDITPDGRYLVYVHRSGAQYHIAVQDLQRGTPPSIITRTEMDESPSVAPNGSMVIYATQDRGKGVLQAVSIDGKVKVKLPSREGEVREPAWSPKL